MKLGLGTIEFAAKLHAKAPLSVSEESLREILATASAAGLTLLDTAAQAGNSEVLLGNCLPSTHSFKLVVRPDWHHPDLKNTVQSEQFETALKKSLQNLKQEHAYALMVNIDDGLLTNQGEKLCKRLENLKKLDLVEKIGISLNDSDEIDRLLQVFEPKIVQLPLNILDHRLIQSGHLQMLHEKGIEIHVRDAFLQGILLEPLHLHPWFWSIKPKMQEYYAFLIQEGLTPVEGALQFLVERPEIDYVLVGAHSVLQLQELLGSVFSANPEAPLDFEPFSCNELAQIDPRHWNLYE